MTSTEKFHFLLLNLEMLKGSEYEFIASKNKDHHLIPEEIERVERLYREFEEKGWMSEAKQLDRNIKVEEIQDEIFECCGNSCHEECDTSELDSILIREDEQKIKDFKWYNPLTW